MFARFLNNVAATFGDDRDRWDVRTSSFFLCFCLSLLLFVSFFVSFFASFFLSYGRSFFPSFLLFLCFILSFLLFFFVSFLFFFSFLYFFSSFFLFLFAFVHSFPPLPYARFCLFFSYVSRAFTLPSSFHILVTHVEDDGFRFWGRVFVPDGGKENEFVSMAEETGEVGRATEKNSSATEMEPENLVESVADEESTMTEDADALFSCANTMEQCDNGAKEKQTRPQRFESLYDDDSNQLERMEEEMKAFLEQDIEDYVDTADLCAAHLPVAVFHEGRWYRGWTMSTEANAVQDAIARVFLIDVGRVVLKETFQLRPWNAALAEARGLKEVRRPPLALPFFLKGPRRAI